MTPPSTSYWQHDHVFGQDQPKAGEKRTIIVIAMTGATMVVEIAAGIAFNSMALLADGLHMASHALALALAVFAYVYTRRHARDDQFSFGAGKVNSLGGYTGAVLLGVFALLMAVESISRFLHPVAIRLDQAILVAVVGLLVNAASAWILGAGQPEAKRDAATPGAGPDRSGGDHNLRSAYLHVLADALTSILAIAALLAARFLDQTWFDSAAGVLGALLVARWSLSLLRATSRVLLDVQASEPVRRAIRESLERHDDTRVSDLHVWSIGPGIHAAEISVVTGSPTTSEQLKALLPKDLGIVHATVEVHETKTSTATAG